MAVFISNLSMHISFGLVTTEMGMDIFLKDKPDYRVPPKAKFWKTLDYCWSSLGIMTQQLAAFECKKLENMPLGSFDCWVKDMKGTILV